MFFSIFSFRGECFKWKSDDFHLNIFSFRIPLRNTNFDLLLLFLYPIIAFSATLLHLLQHIVDVILRAISYANYSNEFSTT